MVTLDRRDFLKLTGIGFSLSAFGVSCRQTSAGRPNIVLCMADDQGWGDMAFNSHPDLHTTNFDAMAAETLRFDRFYAAVRQRDSKAAASQRQFDALSHITIIIYYQDLCHCSPPVLCRMRTRGAYRVQSPHRRL